MSLVKKARPILGDPFNQVRRENSAIANNFICHCSLYLVSPGRKPAKIVKDGLPFGLNIKGQAVGLSGHHDLGYLRSHPDYGSNSQAFLYEAGRVKDLDTQIAPNSGWHLEYATAISNKGQIVGIGSFKSTVHGFLLTPRR